jgi:amino acid permease/DNA-binding transcriptional ArsR family regulator
MDFALPHGGPPSGPDSPFTLHDALGGLPLRRAQALVFMIESLTARAVARSRQAMEIYPIEADAQDREERYLEAFARGREPPRPPTIQQIERHAPDWGAQIPADPRLRAAVAHLLGAKYRFTYQSVPGVRAALGLDRDAVRRAHQQLRGAPLEAVYQVKSSPADRVRWAVAGVGRWVESLPAFWMVYSLTLTETVGAGILALPIAVALVGPLPALAFLVVLGGASTLTLAYLGEAIGRSGVMRSGSPFFGHMVADYLGSWGAAIATSGLALLALIVLTIDYFGVSAVLSRATGVPVVIWPVVLAVAGLYLISRRTLSATFASALLIGAVNIALILSISGIALTHLRVENLLYTRVPGFDGHPFEPAAVALIFGAVLAAFFGHVSICQVAGASLRRDPTARSLISGSVAAQATALVLYSLWVMAVSGAVGPQVLAQERGTSLEPLAGVAGPLVTVLGAVLAVLSMGLASVYLSLALFNLVRERLPGRTRSSVVLHRRRGRLVLSGRKSQAGLSYLGLDSGKPWFQLETQTHGHREVAEIVVDGRWDANGISSRLPLIRAAGLRLTIEVDEPHSDSVRFRVTSPLAVSVESGWAAPGLRPSNLLDQRHPRATLLGWLVRHREVGVGEAAAAIGLSEAATHEALDALREEGLVREIRVGGRLRYQPELSTAPARRVPDWIWKQLDAQKTGGLGRARWFERARGSAHRLLSSGRGRFVLAILPVLFVLVVTEFLEASGRASFTGPLAWTGVVVVSLLAGLIPVLLLVSSRRKGEFVPGHVLRILGHPAVAAVIALLFLANVFVHGLVIWTDPLERASGVIAGVLMALAALQIVRRGALTPRLAIGLWQDLRAGGRAILAVMAGGQPAGAMIHLAYRDGHQQSSPAPFLSEDLAPLGAATIEVPETRAGQLKVTSIRSDSAGDSEPLPAVLAIGTGAEYDLSLTGGELTLPFDGSVRSLELRLIEESV